MNADGRRANCIQCVDGYKKTCLDVGHLFKNFQDALYMIIQMSTAWCSTCTHLTGPNRGVGALLCVSTFKHKRAPMSCLHALEANNWINNNLQRNHQRLQSLVLMPHTTLWTGTMSLWAWFSTALARSICAKMPCIIPFGEVLHNVSCLRYVKLAPVLLLIWVKFDPIQEIRPKVGVFLELRSFETMVYTTVVGALNTRMYKSHLVQPLSLKTLPCHSPLCSCMSLQCHPNPLMSQWWALSGRYH